MNRFLGFALAIVIIVALIAGLSYFASQNSSQFVASTNTNTTCVFCGFSSTLVQNNTTSSASGKKSVSSNTTFVNTFFTTSCVISGVGGFEFRLVSDSTGQPVNASTISAVDKLGCNQENQVVYLDNFSYSGDGWFTPVFPSQATVGGGLNLTVGYEGKTYNFLGDYPPVGTDCVTLSVPSGNVSSTTVMNGSGSYCSAITTSSVTYSSTSSMSFSNSSNNKLGLELLASVNSTDLSQKDSSLLLNITVLNTLATQNNVSYANSWAIANMTHFGEVCNFLSPTGFTVFSGNYDQNNISQGTPLNLWPIVPECPAPLVYNGTSSSVIGALRNVTSYSFFPNSDRANYSVYYIPWGSSNGSMIFGTFPTTITLDQSIFININSSEPTISYLPSASLSVYTLAVGDEWGDLVLIHLTISGCGPFGCDESTITVTSGETP